MRRSKRATTVANIQEHRTNAGDNPRDKPSLVKATQMQTFIITTILSIHIIIQRIKFNWFKLGFVFESLGCVCPPPLEPCARVLWMPPPLGQELRVAGGSVLWFGASSLPPCVSQLFPHWPSRDCPGCGLRCRDCRGIAPVLPFVVEGPRQSRAGSRLLSFICCARVLYARARS